FYYYHGTIYCWLDEYSVPNERKTYSVKSKTSWIYRDLFHWSWICSRMDAVYWTYFWLNINIGCKYSGARTILYLYVCHWICFTISRFDFLPFINDMDCKT